MEGVVVVMGAPVVGMQPQGLANPRTRGQNWGSMNPKSPDCSKAEQVKVPWPGIVTFTSGNVTLEPSPQMLHGGNPGLGGTG